MKTFSVEFAVSDLKGFADRLSKVDGRFISAPMIDVVNTAARDTRERSLDVMLKRLNLARDYVEPKMTLKPATNPATPKATIVASGATITNLERYFRTGGQQVTVPVRWPNGSFRPHVWASNPRAPEKWLKWKPRVGAPKIGVPINQKQEGLRIAVTKGAPRVFDNAFIIRPKRTPNVALVASRAKGDHKGKGKPKTLVGPSVYQMFRAALTPDFLVEVERALAKSVLAAAENQVRKVL